MDERELKALQILRDALDTTPGELDSFLFERCGPDTALRERVAALLRGIGEQELDEAQAETEAHPSADSDALIGTQLGAFRVIERIGRGGMGVVYRGEREGADFRQDVAIKLIRRGFDFDDIRARFLRERRILARLSHPNLARFIDGGVAPDGRPWFALEFVRGEAITRWCEAHALDLRTRTRLFLDVCAAVQYAHAQLVVHRDLKPGNILVDADGHVRLLDFGIARLLGDEEAGATLTTIGSRSVLTPEYAAPEQFGGDTAGVATDVYALGVIVYELIAGVLPCTFDRHDLAAAERTIRQQPPQPLAQAIARDGEEKTAQRLAARSTSLRGYRNDVRGDLPRILDKALAKEPERRYASVAAFADDLARWLGGAPVHVSGNAFGYRLRKFVGRNRVAAVLVTLLSCTLLGTTAFALYSAHQARIQRDSAVVAAGQADAVREYLMLMFRNASEQQDSANLSARDLLKQGADMIFTQFADRPEVGQTTALMLSELYLTLDDPEGATPLLERLLQWPGIERNPEVLANARYNLANSDYHLNKLPRARELLTQAQDFWNTQPDRYADEIAESLGQQALLELAEGKVDQPLAILQKSIAQRRTAPQPDRELAKSLSTLSTALNRAGRHQEAFAAADESYELFEQLGLAHRTIGLSALNSRAVEAMFLDDYAAATVDLHVLIARIRELLGPSLGLSAAQSNLGAALLHEGRSQDAIPPLEEALRIAVEKGGERGRASMKPRVYLAEAYARSRRTADAAALAEKAVEIGTKEYGEKSVFAGTAFRARAIVRLEQRRLPEARSDLDAASAVFAAMGKAGEFYSKSLEPLRAQLAGN